MATPPTFSSGAVLTAAQMNSVGLWLVKTQTVGSAVSSVTVSSAFSADYDNYRIVYSNGVGSANAPISMKLGASVTGYYSIMNYGVYATPTTPLSAGQNNAGSWDYTGYATTTYTAMSVDLLNPFIAKPTEYHAAGWVALTAAGVSAGLHNVATSYTSFIVAPTTGTLTGGTIYVYGYKGTV